MAGVVVGGYGGGIARTQRYFNVDDYGADPTGATNSNAAITAARTALGTEPGLIVFGVGTYLFTNGLNVENGTELGLNQGVMGQGASLTTVKFNGAYCPFEFRNSAWQFNTASEGGEGLSGMWLYGWENTNTNVHAISAKCGFTMFMLLDLTNLVTLACMQAMISRKAIVDPPLTSTSPGVKGQRAIDESHEYVCVDTNSWKRTPISSW